MQLTSWTRVNLVTATIQLSQYQSSPGTVHFKALHNMLLYIRCQPDMGLTYTRHSAVCPLDTHPEGVPPPPVPADLPVPTVSSVSDPTMLELTIDWDVSHTDGLGDPVAMTHEPTAIDERYAYGDLSTMQIPRVASAHTHAKPAPPCTCASTSPIMVLSPPPIEGEMNASHDSVFETVGFSGVVLLSLVTVFSSCPRSKLRQHITRPTPLLLQEKSSNGFAFGWLTWAFHLWTLSQWVKTMKPLAALDMLAS
jgi:hypothetical protein